MSSNYNTVQDRKTILDHLREVGPLSTIQARDELGVMHPGGRVMELRRDGHNIVTDWQTSIDATGRKHRVAKYVLFNKG